VRVQYSDDLCELDFGRWEGKAWDQVPRAELDAWARDVWEYRPGGGESARMLCARWMMWLEALHALRHEQVVVVTHAGVIRAALACAHNGCRDELLRADIPFGSVQALDVSMGCWQT
jgi:alpha-ribazole phosphatase